jgi:hypothetical protein
VKEGMSLKLAAKSIVGSVQLKRFARQEVYSPIASPNLILRFRFGKMTQNDTRLTEISIRVVGCKQIEE